MLINWIKRFLPKPSVASITSNLNKIVAKLNAHQEAKAAEAVRHHEAIEAFTAAKQAALKESELASAISNKIGSLLSV